MRRFLFGAGCYLAGIMTLPLMSAGLNRLDARIVSHDQPYRGLTVEKATRTSDPVAIMVSPGRDTTEDSEASFSSSSPVEIVASPSRGATCQVMLPAAGQCGTAQPVMLELTDVFAQADVKDDEEVPFGQPAPTQVPLSRTALTRDEEKALFNARQQTPTPEVEPPVPAHVVVPDFPIVRGLSDMLPIGPAILVTDTPQDEAEAARTNELREQLQKIIEEKKALLNSHGLELEIKLHQRHVAELKPLKELLALQSSLQELKDKYPDSIAGRRAQELLDVLIQQHHRNERPTPIPDYGPMPSSPPRDDGIPLRRKPMPEGDSFDRPAPNSKPAAPTR